MNLLILTQKIDKNDDILGFFHDWTAEFAKYCEKLTVICLYKGEYDLPDNVRVLSLGKESGASRVKYIFNLYRYIWRERANYDKVFIHMNPEYGVWGGWLWRLLGKPMYMWFTHKSVNWRLRVSNMWVEKMFTASRESFRMKSKKLMVMNHGINVERYKTRDLEQNDVFKIITVGRISPSKDYDTLISAIESLRNEGLNIKVDIIGSAGLPEQVAYENNIKKTVKDKGLGQIINFVGSIPYPEVAGRLLKADLFAHMSQTGSLDKAVLEAMASGVPVVSCNDAVVGDVYGAYKERLAYTKEDAKGLTERIRYVYGLSAEDRQRIGRGLREIVVRDHSMDSLIKRLAKEMEK